MPNNTHKLSHLRRASGILAILLIFNASTAALASEITAENMVELTNASRREAGLNKLTVNARLNLAAQKKAADMFKKQYFEHISPDGITPWYWFDDAGYDYVYAAENLAIDFSTAEGAHSALMKSPGHRENILGASYKEIGIATMPGIFDGQETILIVEEFGATKNERTEAFFESRSGVRSASVESGQGGGYGGNPPGPDEVVLQPINEGPAGHMTPEEADAANGDYLGKVVTGTFAFKNLGTLKAVYTEDIHWRESRGGTNLLLSSRAKLKFMLKNLLKR